MLKKHEVKFKIISYFQSHLDLFEEWRMRKTNEILEVFVTAMGIKVEEMNDLVGDLTIAER